MTVVKWLWNGCRSCWMNRREWPFWKFKDGRRLENVSIIPSMKDKCIYSFDAILLFATIFHNKPSKYQSQLVSQMILGKNKCLRKRSIEKLCVSLSLYEIALAIKDPLSSLAKRTFQRNNNCVDGKKLAIHIFHKYIYQQALGVKRPVMTTLNNLNDVSHTGALLRSQVSRGGSHSPALSRAPVMRSLTPAGI